PSATLLPCTTLFRSELIFQGNILADPYHGVIGLTNLLRYVKKRNIFCPEAQAQADAVFNQINTYPEYLRTFFLDVYLNRVKSVKDRKSTRLNSSHVK